MWGGKKAREQVAQLEAEASNKRRQLADALQKLEEQKLMLIREYHDDATRIQNRRGPGYSVSSTEEADSFGYDMVLKSTNFHDLSTNGWVLDILSKETRSWFASCVSKMHREDQLMREREKAEAQGLLEAFDAKEREREQKEEKKEEFKMERGRTTESKVMKKIIPNHDQCFSIVGVMGYYDKGKTWVLNKLMDTNFPSSKRVATEGISFCMTVGPSNTKWLILDTAGFGSPISFEDRPEFLDTTGLSGLTFEKWRRGQYAHSQVMEYYLRDLTYRMAELIIVVVNDLTVADQKFVDLLENRCADDFARGRVKQLVVVHNFKEVSSEEELEAVWERQVARSFIGRNEERIVKTCAPGSTTVAERSVIFLNGVRAKHIAMVNDHCEYGRNQYNPWAIELLRSWIDSMSRAREDEFSIPRAILQETNAWAKVYVKNFKEVLWVVPPTSYADQAISLFGDSHNGEPFELQDWNIDEASNSVIFYRASENKEIIPHAVFVSRNKTKESAAPPSDGWGYISLDDKVDGAAEDESEKVHHIILQLPGISRNQIKVSVKDSVLSFSAELPNGMQPEAGVGNNMRLIGGRADRGLSVGSMFLDFPLPRGCVTSLKQMKFAPPPSEFKGVLVVSIPHAAHDSQLENTL